MAKRNKNYLRDIKRTGAYTEDYSNSEDRGINEAQSDLSYAKSTAKDGAVVAKDAAIVGGAIASGGASVAATGGAAAAGGAAAGAGATAGAGAAGAGATAAGGASAAAASGVAEGAGAAGVAGESAATSAASESAMGGNTLDVVENIGDATDIAESGLDSVDGGYAEDKTEESKERVEGATKKTIEDGTESHRDAKRRLEDDRNVIQEEKDFYKSKNFLDKKKRAARKRIAQQKINNKGKDDRGIMERVDDHQTSKTGVNQLEATGDAIDAVGRAAGSAVDASNGGRTNARESLGGIGSEAAGAVGRLKNTTERKLTRAAKFALKVPVAGAAAMVLIPVMLLVFATFGVTVATTTSVVGYAEECSVTSQQNPGMNTVIGNSNGFAWENLNNDQMSNATEIVRAAADRDLSSRAAVIALATAMQESRLENISYGDEAGPDSRGLFQQRDSWGPLEDRMDPYKSAGLFYDRLVGVENWETIPLTQAAQKVQISAFPDAYAKHENDAKNVFENVISNANPHSTKLMNNRAWVEREGGELRESFCEDDVEAFPTGTWLNPYCDDHIMAVTSYFGPRAPIPGTSHNKPSYHSGMDFFAYGGPVNARLCATAAGTVTNILSGGGCGNAIIIATDDGFSYVYCHLQSRPVVGVGEHVEAGQYLGNQGTTGNSSGEHLHWEISTLGGQNINAANPMCLIKTKPDILEKLDFSRVRKYSASFDYMCEGRNDLEAWDKNEW